MFICGFTPWVIFNKMSHVLKRAGIAINSALTAMRDPTRQDAVAAFGEVTGMGALVKMRNAMLLSTSGRRVLRERPIIDSNTVQQIESLNLKPSAFGSKYLEFLITNNLSPETRSKVLYIPDEELAYVMLRYRQIHDLWHCLANMPITVEGELGLKVFEFLETGLPMTLLASLVGPLRLNENERSVLMRTYVPWALENSYRSKGLMIFMYEDYWDKEIIQVQELTGIRPVR